MDAYGSIRWKRACADTARFWNIHRSVIHFVPSLGGLAVVVIKVLLSLIGTRNVSAPISIVIAAALYGLLCAASLYLAGWVLDFLLNYLFCSPAALHKEQQSAIEQQTRSIHKLEQEIAEAVLSRQEEAHRKKVRDAIALVPAAELVVLKHILNHQEIESPLLYLAFSTQGRTVEAALQRWEHTFIQRRVEHGTNRTFWSVIPGFRNALEHVLYESPSSQ